MAARWRWKCQRSCQFRIWSHGYFASSINWQVALCRPVPVTANLSQIWTYRQTIWWDKPRLPGQNLKNTGHFIFLQDTIWFKMQVLAEDLCRYRSSLQAKLFQIALKHLPRAEYEARRRRKISEFDIQQSYNTLDPGTILRKIQDLNDKYPKIQDFTGHKIKIQDLQDTWEPWSEEKITSSVEGSGIHLRSCASLKSRLAALLSAFATKF